MQRSDEWSSCNAYICLVSDGILIKFATILEIRNSCLVRTKVVVPNIVNTNDVFLVDLV